MGRVTEYPNPDLKGAKGLIEIKHKPTPPTMAEAFDRFQEKFEDLKKVIEKETGLDLILARIEYALTNLDSNIKRKEN